MRNLKRVLALALALVMMLGMMITASAASYSDAAQIDDDYADAVEILTGMGVFQGTGNGFSPKTVLTRAQASALIYRVITGDVTDKQVSLYAYPSFTDMATGAWYTGYVTYAANGGYIKGYGNGVFGPDDAVTGVQVLAIMLRAIGYGQNGEFEGAAWKDNVLTTANDLGLLKGIAVKTLDDGATRELVAQLLFNCLTKANMVTYTPALGYLPVELGNKPATNSQNFINIYTLAQKVFFLNSVVDHDDWGRPATLWFADTNMDGQKGAKETLYASIAFDALATYTVEVYECDVAKDLGLKKDAEIEAWTYDGYALTANQIKYYNDTINTKYNAFETMGEQGQLTEIYDCDNDGKYEIVTINTYLAKVTDVIDAKYDKNNHLVSAAKLYLDVYYDWADQYDDGMLEIVMTSEKANFDYKEGDMLLVHVNEKDENKFTAEIVDYADSMVGAQSAWTVNDWTHEIEGTVYNDALYFVHDESEYVKTVDYTWYFDQYGNLIGCFEIATKYSYGVVSAIKWVENNNLLEDGYALASITYMDGTTETATVASIGGTKLTSTNVAETKQDNVATWVRQGLYRISTGKSGLVLENTNVLTGATFETGVPALTSTLNAGTSTMFLVWNGKSYDTYTGIKNIPTYASYDKAWYADARNDGVADYIFINKPVDESINKTATYYWGPDAKITVKANLKNDAVESWTITGGYLNGVLTAITTKSEELAYDVYYGDAGNLYMVTLTDGYVVSMTEVDDNVTAADAFKVDGTTYYAVYAKAAADARLVDDVLMADGESYDVSGLTNVITYKEGLKNTIKYDTDAYLYVVFTEGKTGNKIADVVYITDEEGEIYTETPTTPVAPVKWADVATTLVGTGLTDANIAEAEALYTHVAGIAASKDVTVAIAEDAAAAETTLGAAIEVYYEALFDANTTAAKLGLTAAQLADGVDTEVATAKATVTDKATYETALAAAKAAATAYLNGFNAAKAAALTAVETARTEAMTKDAANGGTLNSAITLAYDAAKAAVEAAGTTTAVNAAKTTGVAAIAEAAKKDCKITVSSAYVNTTESEAGMVNGTDCLTVKEGTTIYVVLQASPANAGTYSVTVNSVAQNVTLGDTDNVYVPVVITADTTISSAKI